MGIGYWTLFSPRTTCSSLKFSTKVTGEFWAKMKILFVLPLIFASVFAYENTQPSITVEVMRAKWNAWTPQLGFLRGPAGAPGKDGAPGRAGPAGPAGMKGMTGASGISDSGTRNTATIAQAGYDYPAPQQRFSF